MELSKQQSDAAKAIEAWYKSKEQVFFLSGYAGTGKTTLVKELLSTFKDFIMVAPTGKAASVLSYKTSLQVQTIHSLLYIPNQDIDWTFIALKEKFDKNPKDEELRKQIDEYEHKKKDLTFIDKDIQISPNTVIIVDEGSMVGDKIFFDLVQTGAKILMIGDEAQLPPVKSKAIFHESDKGAILTDIHRQALDSNILRLATKIRMNEKIYMHDFFEGDAVIKYSDEITQKQWLNADQILTDTNASRHKINRFIRNKRGYSGNTPVNGEKIICVRNYWKSYPPKINGVQCETIADFKLFDDSAGSMRCNYANQECQFYTSTYYFNQNYKKMPFLPWTEFTGMALFDYGYCLTVHKSQGSEWDNVIFADSKNAFNTYQSRKPIRQLLYTAITRAAKNFTWVMK